MSVIARGPEGASEAISEGEEKMGKNVINVVVGMLVLSVALPGVQNLRLRNVAKAAKNELSTIQEKVEQRLAVERT